MGILTAIKADKTKGRVRLLIDGEPSCSLTREQVYRERLSVGQELSSGQLQALTMADQSARCLAAALVYLKYRPRSESELKDRLGKRGFDSPTIDSTISQLRQKHVLDDRQFADFWSESRQSFRPQARWLTAAELGRKGVSADVVQAAVGDIDDAENAYRAAQAKTRILSGLDYATLRRRLGAYLKRRGFSYPVIDQTVKRIWRESARDKNPDNIPLTSGPGPET